MRHQGHDLRVLAVLCPHPPGADRKDRERGTCDAAGSDAERWVPLLAAAIFREEATRRGFRMLNRGLTDIDNCHSPLFADLPAGRIAALRVLMELLSGSKQFLAVATESTKETAFQSHSSTVAAMVRELHRGIEKFLTLEKETKAQTQGIKCACALISNTPYERMLPGYIRTFAKILSPLLRSKGLSYIQQPCIRLCSLSWTLPPYPPLSTAVGRPTRYSRTDTTRLHLVGSRIACRSRR